MENDWIKAFQDMLKPKPPPPPTGSTEELIRYMERLCEKSKE